MSRSLVWRDVERLRHGPGRLEGGHFRLVRARSRRADAAQRDTPVGKPLIGVVGPQRQPVLGPRGEHPIRLSDAARNQVIDHDAEIALGPIEYDRRRATCPRRRIQAGNEALRSGFLITCGAVDLAGQEQARQPLCLERGVKFARIDVVVLNGVPRPHDAGPFQSGDRSHHGKLHVFRQGRRYAVRVDGGVVEPFRLEEDLVPFAVAETDDLVLNRRAISRSPALNLAGIHGRTVDIFADDRVGRRPSSA